MHHVYKTKHAKSSSYAGPINSPRKGLSGETISAIWRYALLVGVILFIGGVIWFFVQLNLEQTSPGFQQNKYPNNGSSQIVGTTRAVTAPQLNMRSGPGPNYPVVRVFNRNEIVVSVGEPTNTNGELWIRTATRDGQVWGWTNRKYLSP